MRKTLIATTLLAALAAGCGNQPDAAGVASVSHGSAPPSAVATPTATVDPEEQGRKWAQCMRDHGVPMEDPNSSGINVIDKNVDKSKAKEAMQDCRALAPEKLRAAAQVDDEQTREFARCMRDNGVDVPDPEPGKGLAGALTGDVERRTDAQFKKAFEACRGKLSKPGAAG